MRVVKLMLSAGVPLRRPAPIMSSATLNEL